MAWVILCFIANMHNEVDFRAFSMATCAQNETKVTEIFLVGFGNLQHLKNFIFVLLLIAYLATVTGNMVIITLISTSPKLHSPMYFFLSNLSACEILNTTTIIPNMLYISWLNGGFMSFYGCIIQYYLGSATGSIECLLLTVMAYDRHLAICNPLRYSSIMNINTRNHLAAWAWVAGFTVMVTLVITICHLQFCGLNTIDRLFCDLAPLLQLSSSDSSLVEMEILFIIIFLNIVPFILIIVSYISIFFTILKMSSLSGRQKAFSTCSSHLASVCLFCGSICVTYTVPSQHNELHKFLPLSYTVLTPLLNPIIYSLRNQEMIDCFRYYFKLTNKS
ncbi:olfactory receptor 10A7-like [Aquarana catesbeiana]|uniref:olfactory receptor 10A7-like n=1 Tax=Aquarana catesbeiana TaxID=8400 RepID=UPI003CC9C8BD